MGELAAAVAHQINNPLTTILSDSQLLLEHVKPSSPEFESLSAIVRSGKRAKGVVRRLLAAVRTTEPSIYESVDVVASIRETLALLKPHLARENIPLTENLPTYPVPPVRAVPGELDDVWLNLLLNAHDALVGRPDPAMGIDVEYSAADHLLRVFIWDNGPGIPEDKLADIFKPFFTTKPIGEGTGLGLHIARQVVDRVGGSILVDSLIGVGTRFTVLIPTLP
jgi:two-component system NtrC family sensor kinase